MILDNWTLNASWIELSFGFDSTGGNAFSGKVSNVSVTLGKYLRCT